MRGYYVPRTSIKKKKKKRIKIKKKTKKKSQEISFEVVGRYGEIEERVLILIGGIPPPQTGKMNFAIFSPFDEDNFDDFDSATSVSNG